MAPFLLSMLFYLAKCEWREEQSHQNQNRGVFCMQHIIIYEADFSLSLTGYFCLKSCVAQGLFKVVDSVLVHISVDDSTVINDIVIE